MSRHLIRSLIVLAWLPALAAAGPAGGSEDDERFDPPPLHKRGYRDGPRHRPPWEDPARPAEATPREIPPIIRELFPERAERLERLRREHPAAYDRALMRLHHAARGLEHLRRTDRPAFDARVAIIRLEGEVNALAERLRAAATDAERKSLDRDLAAKLGELFDRKEAEQWRRLERMQEDLDRLKARLTRRKTLRSRIIEKRLNELREDGDLAF
jgi:hypothetical protein